MNSRQVKSEIETLSNDLILSNPFLLKAQDGSLTREEVIAYLVNLRFSLSHAGKFLLLAEDRALELGWIDLAAVFSRKAREEIGHDQWATEDIARLAEQPKDSPTVAEAIHSLLGFVYYLADKDPRFLLCYLTFIESFTVSAAPGFLAAMQKHLGLSREDLTAVSKHEEADRKHSAEGFELIERFCAGLPEDQIRQTLEDSATYIGQCLTACLRTGMRP